MPWVSVLRLCVILLILLVGKEMNKQLLEAEFMLICRNLYTETLDIMSVLYFAEAICQLDKSFSELRVKKVIQKAFAGDSILPSKRQWTALLLKYGFTVKTIQKNIETSRQTIYNIRDHLNEIYIPTHFMQNLSTKDYETIELFVDIIHKVQKVGVYREE